MRDELSTTLKACRLCGGGGIEEIVDLGAQPPANSLRRELSENLPAIPLVLCRCTACGLVQLTETVRPDYLFRHYVWVTGTSQVTRDYSHRFCEQLSAKCKPGQLFVVEVASNDGTFLQRFCERGHRVLGIDPARNIAKAAQRQGVDTIADFFGLGIARQIVADRGRADAVFARNVIPHVADVNDVVAGMEHCLAPEGIGAIEFHRADRILEELHYDSIYHEHVAYHSLHSMNRLLAQHGLRPFDITESPISGGSTVVYFSKTERLPTAAVAAMLARENQLGITAAEPWQQFAKLCDTHRIELRALVDAIKARGKRLIGYGASARSSTLLNYSGIDHRQLDAIADQSAYKHDCYTPGTDILIAAPRNAFALKPDAVLLLAWNFRDEILTQIARDQHWQGEVVVPLPGKPTTLQLQ